MNLKRNIYWRVKKIGEFPFFVIDGTIALCYHLAFYIMKRNCFGILKIKKEKNDEKKIDYGVTCFVFVFFIRF